MTLHRARRPYSKAYATRQLASVQQSLASLRALEVGSDWRRQASKAQNLRSLEAQERKWNAIVNPRPIEVYLPPF